MKERLSGLLRARVPESAKFEYEKIATERQTAQPGCVMADVVREALIEYLDRHVPDWRK